MSDSLLQRVAAGDLAAMQQCMDEYGGMIWSLARRFCASLSEAEDAVQEVFIAVWESAGRFDPGKGAEVTFVATIARRRLIDSGRRRTRRERIVSEAGELPPRESPPPSATVTIGEEAQRAREAMEQLSPDQRRVLDLAVTRGCTHEEISRITELPLGTVKTHARRGLIRVRALLRESGAKATREADE